MIIDLFVLVTVNLSGWKWFWMARSILIPSRIHARNQSTVLTLLFVAQGQWIEQTARSYNWPWLNEVIMVVWIRLAIVCLFRFTGAHLLFFFQTRRKKKGKFDKAIVHSMHSICDQMDFIHWVLDSRIHFLLPCGLLVRTPDSHGSGDWFESNQKPTTPGKSCGSTVPLIALRGQPTGSHAPMVSNYSCCVVLGSETA